MAKETITYEGIKVSYEPKMLNSWTVQKKIAQGGLATFEALDLILCGEADEVAAKFDDDMGKMIGLAQALALLGNEAKN